MRILGILATGWSRFIERHSRRPNLRESLCGDVGGMAWFAVFLVVAGTLFASLVLDANTPNASVRANRFVAADVSTPPAKVRAVLGVFFVGPSGENRTAFPFMMVPGEARDRIDPASMTGALERRFKDYAQTFRKLAATRWTSGPCFAIPPAELDLGYPQFTGIATASSCLVVVNGARTESMVVVGAVVSGKRWPFAKRICRLVAEAVVNSQRHGSRPDYVGCVLIDRPDRERASDRPKVHTYEVRPDGTVAWMRRR
jgi:hypothetical protein